MRRRIGSAVSAALVGAAAPALETRDELLVATGDAVWRGDLTTAHVALTRLADREAGRPDTALDFWSELLALLRCEPLAAIPAAQAMRKPLRDPWDHLRRLVQIERMRLGARRETRGAGAAAAGTTPGEQEGGIFWPVEREHWSDELPMPAVVSHCGEQPGPDPGLTERRRQRARGGAGDERRHHPPLVTTRRRRCCWCRRRCWTSRAATRPPPPRRWRASSAWRPTRSRLSSASEMVLASGVAALAWPHLTAEELMARGRAALALPLAPETRRSLSLLLAERLIALGKQDEAVAVLGPPPHGQDAVGRYIAFRQAEAHARAGRRAELLAEAREVLDRRSRRERRRKIRRWRR